MGAGGLQGNILNRLSQLQLGDASPVFGCIDRLPEAGGESFHRWPPAVSDEDQEPLVVDWRAPVASPTGPPAAGPWPAPRRHFAAGPHLLSMEDEVFGELLTASTARPTATISGIRPLIAAPRRQVRTGRLGDIVATIQGSRTRSSGRCPSPACSSSRGGPRHGKTVVALHRAAYLLYTHRFPSRARACSSSAPTACSSVTSSRSCPQLGEAGVEQVVLADLIPEHHVCGPGLTAPPKGDDRMVDVAAAVHDQSEVRLQRLEVGFHHPPPAGRRERKRIVRAAAASARTTPAAASSSGGVRCAAGGSDASAPTRRRCGPRSATRPSCGRRSTGCGLCSRRPSCSTTCSAAGAAALRRSGNRPTDGEADAALVRRPPESADDVVWTNDVRPARRGPQLLGPPPREEEAGRAGRRRGPHHGHIVVDEAQDLPRCSCQHVTRRSLNGSMTIVGDIAQATGARAHDDWESVLAPPARPPAGPAAELTVGYRIPPRQHGPRGQGARRRRPLTRLPSSGAPG